MERLTWENQNGDWGVSGYDIKCVPRKLYGAICKLRDYERTGITPKQIYNLDRMYQEKCEEVASLEKKLPPCKVGDTVYEIHPLTGKITERKIRKITICNAPDLTVMYESGFHYLIVNEDFGKTVFLTQPEAEEALKRMEEDNNAGSIWEDMIVNAWQPLPKPYQPKER